MHLGQLVFVQTQLFQTRALRIGATDHIIYGGLLKFFFSWKLVITIPVHLNLIRFPAFFSSTNSFV